MVLKKCYVFAFGNLKNFTYDFSSGLNTVKEENGWGKSTLATFIKAMFYGLNNDKKHSVAENERLKYKPWNSTEHFGGYVEFERGGILYRIERFFGNKATEDTVKLIDVSSGKSYSNTEDLGRRIFEIDEEGFLSTTYLGQKDVGVKSNSSITAKFNQVFDVQDTDAFDKALKKLDEKAKIYKLRGEKGLIADTKRELFAVEDQINGAVFAEKVALQLKESANQLESQVVSLKAETEALAEKVAIAGQAEAVRVRRSQLADLKSKRDRLEEDRRKINVILNGQAIDRREYAENRDKVTEYFDACAKEEIAKSDLEKLRNAVNVRERPNNTPLLTVCWSAFTLSLLFTVLSFLMSFGLVSSIIGGVVSALILALSIFVTFRQVKGRENNAIGLLVEEKKRELEKFTSLKLDSKEKIDLYLSSFNLGERDYNSAFNRIAVLENERNVLEKELSSLNQSIEKLDVHDENFADYSGYDVDELRYKLKIAQEKYSNLASELARKRSDIKRQQELADALPDLEGKQVEISEKIQQYTEEYNVLVKTAEFLKKADENLKIKYRAPLENSLNKYLNYVVGNVKRAEIDIELNLTVMENGKNVSADYYSKGYQNLFGICKRFALIDVLFTKEKPFIILDDPFVNLDDEKLSASLDLIKKLAEEYQIIYFVCHESRKI